MAGRSEGLSGLCETTCQRSPGWPLPCGMREASETAGWKEKPESREGLSGLCETTCKRSTGWPPPCGVRKESETAGWKEKPGRSEGGMPNGWRGISGVEAKRSRSSSDSCSRFVLALKEKSFSYFYN